MSSLLTRRNCLSALAALAAVTAVIGFGQPTQAAPGAAAIAGSYTGSAVRTSDGEMSALVLDVAAPVRRKLSAVLTVNGGAPINLKGTLSRSGEVSLSGKVQGKQVVIHGQFTVTDVKTIAGRWKVGSGKEKGSFTVASP